jgi:hypothetical protein
MYREARKLERKGFSGAAQQIAAAAAQQKLTNERPGFLSADTAIEEQKLQLEAAKKKAAIASGMRPQETRRGLYEDIRAAAGQGLTGAEGVQQLAGFRSRATQLGVTPEAFDRTVGGKLGVALPAVTPTPTATTTPPTTTVATTTPPVVAPAVATPAAPRVGKIGDKSASAVNRALRESPTTQPGTVGIDAGFARMSGASGDTAEFLKGVRKLTSPEGGDLFRSAAVDELNKQRMAAGKAPLPREEVLQGLLEQDRAPERAAAAESALRLEMGRLEDFLGRVKPDIRTTKPKFDLTTASGRIAERKSLRKKGLTKSDLKKQQAEAFDYIKNVQGNTPP